MPRLRAKGVSGRVNGSPSVASIVASWRASATPALLAVDGRRGDRDAGEAGTEYPTIATLIAASPGWGERARDRATSWRVALDDPGQSETGGGRATQRTRCCRSWAGRGPGDRGRSTLADCLDAADERSVEEAMQRYEDLRRPRANRILIGSRGRKIRTTCPIDPNSAPRRGARAGDPLRQSAWLYG